MKNIELILHHFSKNTYYYGLCAILTTTGQSGKPKRTKKEPKRTTKNQR